MLRRKPRKRPRGEDHENLNLDKGRQMDSGITSFSDTNEKTIKHVFSNTKRGYFYGLY